MAPAPVRALKVHGVVLLALLSAACEGATWARTEIRPPVTTTTVGARWAQYCTFNGASNLDDINRFLKDQEQQGCELVRLAGRNATLHCFKLRLPSWP